MLLKLFLTKEKRFFYKIKIKTEKDFLVATAPKPRNLKQKQSLIDFLIPFEKKIIYPDEFNIKGFPAPYPVFEIKCKKMISNFLEFCKKNHPNVAAITPNGLIKNNFYFDLSEYVGRIILITKEENESLKNELLAHSGTIIEFSREYDKNESSVAVLTMPTKRKHSKM